MPNTLLNSSIITREYMRILVNNLKFAGRVRRDYDARFANEGGKIGDTLSIRLPVRFTVSTGQAIDLQDVTERTVPLVIDQQKHIDTVFNDADLALRIEDFSSRYIKPRVAALANEIDHDGTNLYRDIYNAIGTPGTVPNSSLTYLQVLQRLQEEAAPMDELLSMVVTPAMQATIINAEQALFHAGQQISRQYRMGRMGIAHGFTWYMDQNLRTHTSGTFTAGSTPLVNGAGQTGNSLITDGWAVSTLVLRRGDVFEIGDDVFAVNPQNRQSTGVLRQFVVTDDVTSDGAGAATIPISPAITPTGPLQTVSDTPDNDDAITPLGAELTASPQGLGFHKEAFVLAMVDLPMPRGTDMGARVSSKQLGISMRMIRDYDINLDRRPCRVDVLYGWATLYPELACRVVS